MRMGSEHRGRLLSLLLALGLLFCVGGCASDTGAGDDVPALSEIRDASARSWRYVDDPATLAEIRDTAWTEADYDDTAWQTAAGTFGEKDGALEALSDDFMPTVCLQAYDETGDTIPTYCFRLVFRAEAEDLTTPLAAEIAYDDAVIVYLNGEPVFSGNTPAEGYSSLDSYGSAEAYGPPETGTVALDRTQLREGVNVLAVELHQANETSSDVYFSMGDLQPDPVAASLDDPAARIALQNDTTCLGVGGDSSEVLVTWQGPIFADACVQVNPASDPDFSEIAATYPARAVYPDSRTGSCTYRAVLDDLAPGAYVYRTVTDVTSDAFPLQVAEPQGAFSFLCHGDPQISDAEDTDAITTYQTLAEQVTGEVKPAFVLSLGDQSDDDDDPALFRRFTGTPLLKSVALAAIVGNHEQHSDQFSRFFYLPNMDAATVDEAGDMSGDYWFFRNNTLFLCLNANREDAADHAAFMQEARKTCEAQYGTPVWTVAALHFSFFSAGRHAQDDNIVEQRDAYAEAFQAAGVDVVFSGHDHSYTRSKPMQGSAPAKAGERGIVYFTLGSSTGSKLYDLTDGDFDYVAFARDDKYPAMTRVDVTDRELTVTTYQERDGKAEVLDRYTLTK